MNKSMLSLGLDLNYHMFISDSKRCRKRKRDRSKKIVTTLPPTTTLPGVDLRNLCIRKNTKYLVYKAILENEVFIAFDDLEENTVEVFRWIIIKGRGL